MKLRVLIIAIFLTLTLASQSWSENKKSTDTDSATRIEMVLVRGGCYEMGDSFGDGFENEKPVHEVCLDDFYLSKYAVTQGQWKAIMGDNPSYFKSGDNYPVESVSWRDVDYFIEKLNGKTGRKYRRCEKQVPLD